MPLQLLVALQLLTRHCEGGTLAVGSLSREAVQRTVRLDGLFGAHLVGPVAWWVARVGRYNGVVRHAAGCTVRAVRHDATTDTMMHHSAMVRPGRVALRTVSGTARRHTPLTDHRTGCPALECSAKTVGQPYAPVGYSQTLMNCRNSLGVYTCAVRSGQVRHCARTVAAVGSMATTASAPDGLRPDPQPSVWHREL